MIDKIFNFVWKRKKNEKKKKRKKKEKRVIEVSKSSIWKLKKIMYVLCILYV